MTRIPTEENGARSAGRLKARWKDLVGLCKVLLCKPHCHKAIDVSANQCRGTSFPRRQITLCKAKISVRMQWSEQIESQNRCDEALALARQFRFCELWDQLHLHLLKTTWESVPCPICPHQLLLKYLLSASEIVVLLAILVILVITTHSREKTSA